MKWIFLLFFLYFQYADVNAATISPNQNEVSKNSISPFKKKLIKTLRLKSLDSLEVVFSDFLKDNIASNQLKRGHAALDQIIADKDISDTLRILAYKNKAILYGQIDNTKKRKSFVSALKIINEKKVLLELIPIYEIEIAKTYLSQSNFLGATRTLNKVNISSLQNPEKKVEVLGLCGLLYAEMDDTIQAIDKFNEALTIAKQHNDYFGLGTIHSSLGTIYVSKIKQSQKAIEHYRISMNAFHKAGYDHYALGSKTDIGVAYTNLNQLDSAFHYLEECYLESIKIGSTYDQSLCAKGLGILYNKINQPQLALKMCTEAKTLIWTHASDKFRNSCALCLSTSFEMLNEYDSSLYYYKLYHAYLDSNLNKDETKAIAKFNGEIEKQAIVAEQEKLNLKKDLALKTRNLYITFLCILSVLIAGIFLLILRGNKNRKERALIEQEERSQREFSQLLLQSQEDEKIRISRELHDSIGQDLILLKNKAKVLKDEELESTISTTLNNVRRITQGLHPFVLEQFGITTALRKLIEIVDANSSIFITEEVAEIDHLLSKQQELGVYRIVQEAINNILKHSDSPSASIVVKKENQCVILSIKDFGKGFNWGENSKRNNSLGMKTLKERAKILNAEFKVFSELKKGTTIYLKIPITDA